MKQLVDQGYADVIFSLNGVKIEAIKSFIASKNPILNRLIENSTNSTQVLIDFKISVKTFRVLLKYYGYGRISIDTSNMYDLLIVCNKFKESTLCSICEK